MFTGNTCHAAALLTAIAGLTGAAILNCGVGTADTSQDDQFLALLEQKEIPALENVPSLIASAHRDCHQLDSGVSAGDLLVQKVNRAYGIDPAERQYPTDRLNRTMARFIAAAVEAYCPYNQPKISSLAMNPVAGESQSSFQPGTPELQLSRGSGSFTARPARNGGTSHANHSAALVTLITPLPAGEIADPNAPQVPAISPPVAQIRTPRQPAVSPPKPRQTPPPPPPQQKPTHPPVAEAPPPPPQAPPPPPPEVEPPAVGPQPGSGGGGSGARGGDGTGGGSDSGTGGGGHGSPARPAPEPPSPPGFVRLAP